MPRDIASLCHGQRCYLMFPVEGSAHDPSKVVPCHLRIGGVAGGSQKPPPVCCVPGCFECHAILDGRAQTKLSKDEIRSMTLVALNQWLAYLWNNEFLIGVMP